MPNALAAQLRAIADQLDNVQTVTGGPVLQAPGVPLNLAPSSRLVDLVGTDGLFKSDYWQEGDIGCMKGARYSHYVEAITGASYWHGNLPLQMSVLVAPKTDRATWADCLASAGDVGWIPAGASYRPKNPLGGNYDAWVAAGCPRANAGGAYDNKGDLLPSNRWQEYYDRLRNQLG